MTDHPTRALNEQAEEPHTERPTQRLAETRPCLRCGQPMFSAEAGIGAGGAPDTRFGVNKLIMTMETEPGIFAPHYARSRCFALICPQCGYTELYTVNPQALLGAEP